MSSVRGWLWLAAGRPHLLSMALHRQSMRGGESRDSNLTAMLKKSGQGDDMPEGLVMMTEEQARMMP